ncbi:MAG: SDR family NAD(P)-dependent oxidoreductase [Anaerolineales bacterium]
MDDIFSAKTTLVTGASGLLGGAVAKALLEAGHRVRAMARDPRRVEPLARQGAEVVQADMIDPASLERAASGCQVVLHFAGALTGDFAGADYFYQVNVEGTLHLARAALAAGVERFVHTSSAWVYGFDAGPGTNERSPYLVSDDAYIDTKIEAERRLQQLRLDSGLPLVITQPSELYGPGDRHWTLIPLRFIQTGKMILVNGGSGLIHPIYVDDAVAGTLAAARRGRIGEAYLLYGPEVVSLKRFYAELAGMLGRKWIPSVPGWLARMLVAVMEGWSALTHRPPLFSRSVLRSNMMHASYDGGKAREELDFMPRVSLQAGMSAVSAWLAAENPLDTS